MFSSTIEYSSPKEFLSKFFPLKRNRGSLSIFPAIGNTMVGCVMLGLSEAFFLLDLRELCEVLDLSGKTGERHTEFPWTSSTAKHLVPDCKALVFMKCSLELDETCVMQRGLNIASIVSEKS